MSFFMHIVSVVLPLSPLVHVAGMEGRQVTAGAGPVDNTTAGLPAVLPDPEDAPLPLFWRFVSAFWADHLQEVAIGIFLCLLTACYRGLFSCCHRSRRDPSEVPLQPSPPGFYWRGPGGSG